MPEQASKLLAQKGAASDSLRATRTLRVGFVDHAYHQRTRSSEFFKSEVLAGHEIEEWWDDRWHSGKSPDAREIAERDYDCVVVWQAEEIALTLTSLGARNIVFVPMWDGAHALPDSYWTRLVGVRIVSFCHALHERVQALGLPSLYAQYFPDPGELQVTEFSTLRGLFWQRRPEISWQQIALLTKGTKFAGIHLHLAQDPDSAPVDLPTCDEMKERNITTSSWFESRRDFEALLEAANVFFAPREREGIGFSFLEAMAAGMCVVAPNSPTMSEYLTDGISGRLWTVARPQPLDLSKAEEMGARARQAVVLGSERWKATLPDLREFVAAEWDDVHSTVFDTRRFIDVDRDAIAKRHAARSIVAQREHVAPQRANSGGIRVQGLVKRDNVPQVPLVTVVCVTLNAADVFSATISTVLAQDYERLEVIVVDGGSSDGTLDRIVEYEEFIDYWLCEPDEGPYDAMGKGAALAHGRYVLFLNAGDWFAGEAAISQALRFAPQDADFIYGHHVYRTIEGVEELHKANDFESTWRRLNDGQFDGLWLAGVPGHQATFTRTALLQESRGYDTSLSIAADHDFLYRQRALGARFHHSDNVIAVYVSGGHSWQNQGRCFDEWLEVACRYGPCDSAKAFFEPMKHQRPFQTIRPEIESVRDANRRLRLRRIPRALRRILHHRAMEIRIRRSGLFFSSWYLETYPDVAASGIDPIRHYVRHGAREGRDPSPFFQTGFYLSINRDVRSAGSNPLDHYLQFGAAEGRSPNHWIDGRVHLPPGWSTSRGLAIDVAEWLGQATADEIISVWSKLR